MSIEAWHEQLYTNWNLRENAMREVCGPQLRRIDAGGASKGASGPFFLPVVRATLSPP